MPDMDRLELVRLCSAPSARRTFDFRPDQRTPDRRSAQDRASGFALHSAERRGAETSPEAGTVPGRDRPASRPGPEPGRPTGATSVRTGSRRRAGTSRDLVVANPTVALINRVSGHQTGNGGDTAFQKAPPGGISVSSSVMAVRSEVEGACGRGTVMPLPGRTRRAAWRTGRQDAAGRDSPAGSSPRMPPGTGPFGAVRGSPGKRNRRGLRAGSAA